MNDFFYACVYETDRFGGGGIMLRCAITYNESTELKIIDGNLNATRYMDEILTSVVLLFPLRHIFDQFLQQDKTPLSRCTCVSMNVLEYNHVRVLQWPPMSQDLSPIEHLWDELGRRFRNNQNPQET